MARLVKTRPEPLEWAVVVTCPCCTLEQADTCNFCSGCGAALQPECAATITLGTGGRRLTSDNTLEDVTSIHGNFLTGATVANRYRIVSLAGKGGMDEVYRADDLRLGQTVALKFLRSGPANDPDQLARFHAEVRLTRQISHPNVCRVYDIAEIDGQHFLSMEYVDGEDLGVLMRRIGPLPLNKGCEMAQQLCAGLSADHGYGVVHRDLKPANIMIDGRGQVRITDFGLAKLVSGVSDGEIVGTPAYMAPEQLSRGEATIQSDLYSVGLILYEMFTGAAVFQPQSLPTLRQVKLEFDPESPSALTEEMDESVEQVVRHCLAKAPHEIPKSARAVAAALPGADRLAAALAAGETPLPELVAAAA